MRHKIYYLIVYLCIYYYGVRREPANFRKARSRPRMPVRDYLRIRSYESQGDVLLYQDRGDQGDESAHGRHLKK